MPRPLLGDQPLTLAERAARHRLTTADRHRRDLERILEANTKSEADAIAYNGLRIMDWRARRKVP